MISNEPIRSLWDGLALELEHLAAPHCLPHGFLEATLCQFGDEGFDFFEDVFTCVASPAGRAGKEVLGLSYQWDLQEVRDKSRKGCFGCQ